jgi:hypothetical protein
MQNIDDANWQGLGVNMRYDRKTNTFSNETFFNMRANASSTRQADSSLSYAKMRRKLENKLADIELERALRDPLDDD